MNSYCGVQTLSKNVICYAFIFSHTFRTPWKMLYPQLGYEQYRTLDR